MTNLYNHFLRAVERAHNKSGHTLVRPKDAAEMLSVSKKQLYILARQADFPAKIQIGSRAVGWRLSDLEEWIDSRSVSKEGAVL